MTVLTESSSITFNGNGATTAFPTGFRFIETSHLTVQLTSGGVTTTLTEGTHYTVDGADEQDGGTVNMVTAPAVGETLYIERNTPILQSVDLRPSGPYLADDIEEMHDYRCLVEQELRRDVDALIALGDLTDITAANFSFVSKDFTTDADDVESTFPLSVAVVGGSTATDAWATYLQNRDDPSERFDAPPSIQWEPGAGDTISVKMVSGLKPGTAYRLRIGVKIP